jgi:hypothetical protein
MHDDQRPETKSATWIADEQAMDELAEPRRAWNSEAEAEELCEQILQEHPELEERQLWRALAAYRQSGRPRGATPICPQLSSADRRKLSERVRLLVGRLPVDSLREFSGLVAFTETFLTRLEFICDLVVYLFAEREKGPQPDGTEGRCYVEFFVQKLMWELDVVSRIGSELPLSALEAEYLDWLMDRILDGEVLL